MGQTPLGRALALIGGPLVAVLLLRLPLAGAIASPRTPPVVDLHVDLSYRVGYGGGTLGGGSGQYVASRLRAGNVVGVVLPLFVPKRVAPEGPRASDFDASFERLISLIPRTPPYALPGCNAQDSARPGVRDRAVRTWLSFEGAGPLAEDKDSVSRWTARGARIFGLVHTWDNALATSSGNATPSTTGLTDAGREFVARVFAAGGLVDVSHASDASTDEVLGLAASARKPVIATHSNARAVTSHPRNLTDDQIRAIAATGGIVGVNFHSRFLVSEGRAHIADVVRHVLHLVQVAGITHVGIGSDFEGDIIPPVELTSAGSFPRLAEALTAAGMPAEDVAKVFGANALRLLCPPDAPPLKK
jgi:membrane dipeptidase